MADEIKSEDSNLTSTKCELVFGLVGPTGVDLTRVCDALTAQLKSVGYQTKIITLSSLILPYKGVSRSFANEFGLNAELHGT